MRQYKREKWKVFQMEGTIDYCTWIDPMPPM